MLQCLFRKLAVSFSHPLCFYSFFIFIHRSHCVCVCARELLLLYSTCEDIRLHLKSAKHRNKYLKEFSYNMQMSTHMPALIYPHTNTHTKAAQTGTLIHTQVRGSMRVQDGGTRLILLAHFHLIFFSNFMGFRHKMK